MKVSVYCLRECSGQPHVTPDMASRWCQTLLNRIKTFIWFAPVNRKQIILPTAEKQDQNCPKLSNLLINHSEIKCLSSRRQLAISNDFFFLFFFFLHLTATTSADLQDKHPAGERKSKGDLSKCLIELYHGIWMCVGSSVSSEVELSDVHPGAQSPLIPVIRQEHSVAFLQELKEEALVTPDGNTDKCF